MLSLEPMGRKPGRETFLFKQRASGEIRYAKKADMNRSG